MSGYVALCEAPHRTYTLYSHCFLPKTKRKKKNNWLQFVLQVVRHVFVSGHNGPSS